MKTALQIIRALGLVVMLGGCASNQPQKPNVVDIMDGVYYRQEGDQYLIQHRTMTINGMIPVRWVGGVYHFRPQRGGWSTAIKVMPSESTVLIREYESGATYKDVLNIRAQLQDLQDKALAVIRAKLDEFANKQANPKTTNSPEPGNLVAKTPQQQLDDTYNDLKNALFKKNVQVYQWAYENTSGGSVHAGDQASLNRDKSDQVRGYFIVAGVREQALWKYIPPSPQDLIVNYQGSCSSDIPENKERCEKDWGMFMRGLQVPTFIRSARHVAFLEETDLVSRLASHLQVDAKELIKNPERYLGKDFSKFVFDYYSGLLQSLSSQGHLGEASEYIKSVTEDEHLDTDTTLNETDGWSPFFVVTTEACDLFRINGSKETGQMCNEDERKLERSGEKKK